MLRCSSSWLSNARKEAIAREVVAVAREIDHSPAQVALAWLRQRPVSIIPIIGARKLSQVKDNLDCIGVSLVRWSNRTSGYGQSDRDGLSP